MNDFPYTPAQVQITGWNPDGLRDLRLKGHIESYGQQGENGRWQYGGLDMVAFWCAKVRHQANRRVDLRQLFVRSRWIAEDVAKHVAGVPTARFCGFGYREMHTWVENGLHLRSLPRPVRFRTDTWEQVGELRLWDMEIIDTEMMANAVPEWLREIVGQMNFGQDA